MASNDRITVIVEEPPTATTPLENTSDSLMEDVADIYQLSEIGQAMASGDRISVTVDAPSDTAQAITQILELLPKARDHRLRTRAREIKKPYIYRVPHRLREVNKRAYEPNVISIGPYHNGNERFKVTEAIKHSFFVYILEKNNSVADKIVWTMQSTEAKVRECYEEPSDHLGSKEFLEMMVYDGCFIVLLILGHSNEDIFKERGIIEEIVHDLLLLENQLPFFVLSELYHIIAPEEEDVHQLYHIIAPEEENVHQLAHCAIYCFRKCSLFHLFDNLLHDKEIKHLLDLVHSCHHPSKSGIRQYQNLKKNAISSDEKTSNSPIGVQNNFFSKWMGMQLLAARQWKWNCMHLPLTASESTSQRQMKFIGNATELDDAGINFLGATLQKMEDPKQEIETEFDIIFTKDTKVLMIPTLRVEDSTERLFRNYIAYEQFIPNEEPMYFSDYVSFMDNLINTSKDVQLLRKSGIIDNWLGDDEAVAQMFNRLLDSVWWSEDNFYYAETFKSVNDHCEKRWNRWKAALKKNYFNSPWSLISFIAATVLIVLAITQTVFSVLSYSEQKN